MQCCVKLLWVERVSSCKQSYRIAGSPALCLEDLPLIFSFTLGFWPASSSLSEISASEDDGSSSSSGCCCRFESLTIRRGLEPVAPLPLPGSAVAAVPLVEGALLEGLPAQPNPRWVLPSLAGTATDYKARPPLSLAVTGWYSH